jgi:hypothetical protein
MSRRLSPSPVPLGSYDRRRGDRSRDTAYRPTILLHSDRTKSGRQRQPESASPSPGAGYSKIVPSPVIETNPKFFFGSGDGSNGYYAERPNHPERPMEW